ncbi:MAG TPA: hypothetical protein VLB83_03995 [Candidatus Paceibacterota bacterium]|nr:hypothetical protein [Candidatus Paceibacterota bacterium]
MNFFRTHQLKIIRWLFWGSLVFAASQMVLMIHRSGQGTRFFSFLTDPDFIFASAFFLLCSIGVRSILRNEKIGIKHHDKSRT